MNYLIIQQKTDCPPPTPSEIVTCAPEHAQRVKVGRGNGQMRTKTQTTPGRIRIPFLLRFSFSLFLYAYLPGVRKIWHDIRRLRKFSQDKRTKATVNTVASSPFSIGNYRENFKNLFK